jgi:transposase
LRDLVRAREDLRGDLMACRQRISKLLLRRGLVWPGSGSTWSQRHLSWLGPVRFDDPLVELVCSEHLAGHEVLFARRDRLERAIDERAGAGPWSGLVGRLRCLRGVATLTAVGLVAEVGGFAAFDRPRRLASYVGLVPSESSTGTRRRQGAITKAGSGRARRLLIEAA